MKAAFHFSCLLQKPDDNYVYNALTHIFNMALDGSVNLRSKIYLGDILFHNIASDIKKEDDKTTTHTFNKEKFIKVVDLWLDHAKSGWLRIYPERLDYLSKDFIFGLCLSTIDQTSAEAIHNKLSEIPEYIGALEINDTSKLHWVLYTNYLSPKYKIRNKDLFILWDGISEDSQDEGDILHWKEFGFNNVEFESLGGIGTIFDKYHNFEHAKNIAMWRKHASDILATTVDNIIFQLQDAAPKLGTIIWAAISSFNAAETQEEFSHTALSCRRLIEYVADILFPPTEDINSNRKLGEAQFKNRLLAFAGKERKSDTNIDVICVSTKLLSEQLDKLYNLQNKGIHKNIIESEARRCLIRTLLIIDDFASLKRTSLPSNTEVDTDFFKQYINSSLKY